MADRSETGRAWHAYYNVHGDPFVVEDPARPAWTTVATVSTSPDDYGRANALLLAAAPLMLAVLREARAELDRWGYGDFHYGNNGRDAGVLATIGHIDAVLARVEQTGGPLGDADRG